MHLVLLHAWTGCVVTKKNTRVGRGRQRQALLTTLYGKYLRGAVAGILMLAVEMVKDVQATEFSIDDMGDERGRAVCENSERVASVAFSISPAERFRT